MMGNVNPPAPSKAHRSGKGSRSEKTHEAWLQVMPTMAMIFKENDEMPRLLSTGPFPLGRRHDESIIDA